MITRILIIFSPGLDPGGKPGAKHVKAILDGKPNALKCRDRQSNPGLIGAKRGKIRCTNMLTLFVM